MKFLLLIILVVALVAGILNLKPEYRGALPLPASLVKQAPRLSARLEPLVSQMSKATEFSKTPTDAPAKSDILALEAEFRAELNAASGSRRESLVRALRVCDILLEMWAQYEATVGSALDSRSKPSVNRRFFNRAILQRWYDYNANANPLLQAAFAELKMSENSLR